MDISSVKDIDDIANMCTNLSFERCVSSSTFISVYLYFYWIIFFTRWFSDYKIDNQNIFLWGIGKSLNKNLQDIGL